MKVVRSVGDSMGVIMVASVSIFMIVLLGAVAFISYKMVNLTYSIASNASGEKTQAPFVALQPYNADKGKCFSISHDFTVPDDGILYVSLGKVEQKAEFYPYYWWTCFDSSVKGDLMIRGVFEEEEREFGPYTNVWGKGTATLGSWTVSSSTGEMVGILKNVTEGTIPANMQKVYENNEDRMGEFVSVTSTDKSVVTLKNSTQGVNFWGTDPFGIYSPDTLNYADGIKLRINDGNTHNIIYTQTK